MWAREEGWVGEEEEEQAEEDVCKGLGAVWDGQTN